jgi:hypothetical protein
MKKLFSTLVAVLAMLQISYGQYWTGGPTGPITYSGGNVGIGTTNPNAGALQINGSSDLLTLYSDGSVAHFNAYNNSDFRIIQRSNAIMTFWTNTVERIRIDAVGNVGVGTQSPSAKLHISGNGTSINGYNPFNGNLVIQGNTAVRSIDNGAQLEFAIPANADGSNIWGQARIITVAGNTGNGDATGKMVLGTRRYWSKPGIGLSWNYGDDLVIDGAGNVGVGTLTPDAKLAVNGTIHTKEVKVNLDGWSDYVFNNDYQLKTIPEVAEYIKQNHHLPDVPSAADVEKNGVNLGEISSLLLKKIEELTLYIIEKDKQLKKQQEEITSLKDQRKEIDQLKAPMAKLLK